MKILFTKKLDKTYLKEKLGSSVSFDFLEVISFTIKKQKPFELKNKSLIFTSTNGVKSFFENHFVLNEKFTEQNFNRVYAVGNKTKSELRKHGFGTYKLFRNAEELAEFIIEHATQEKFLHFCGNLTVDVLDSRLPLQNIDYRKVEMYSTKLLFPKVEQKYDALVFFSPSGVRSFAKFNSLEVPRIFSLGKTTEKEIKKYTYREVITSDENRLNDLLSLINENKL